MFVMFFGVTVGTSATRIIHIFHQGTLESERKKERERDNISMLKKILQNALTSP